MGKSVIEQAYAFFNNQDLEKYMTFFHQDFKVYDLKTGELIVEGTDNIYESNKEPVSNPNKLLYADNVVVKGKFEFFYKTYSYRESTQIVICETEAGLLKNVWVAGYE